MKEFKQLQKENDKIRSEINSIFHKLDIKDEIALNGLLYNLIENEIKQEGLTQ